MKVADRMDETIPIPILKRAEGATRRRSLFEIKGIILHLIAKGYKKPTNLMYAANTSWQVLHQIIEEFKAKELVAVSNRRIELTERGWEICSKFREVYTVLQGKQGRCGKGEK